MAAIVNLRARQALDDCRATYAELKKTADPNVFRCRWFGFIALLRAVGHVLKEIDGAPAPEIKSAIASHWTGSEPIFKSFIKDARDIRSSNTLWPIPRKTSKWQPDDDLRIGDDGYPIYSGEHQTVCGTVPAPRTPSRAKVDRRS